MTGLTTSDETVVEQLRADGITTVPGVLAGISLATARIAFEQAYRDAGKARVQPGTRITLSGEKILRHAPLASMCVHTRLMTIAAAFLDEPYPWLWMIRANRYAPPHDGVRAHSDGFPDELAPPYTAVAVFLDDIDETSGALTFSPGSHARHYRDGAAKTPPSQEEIESAPRVPVCARAGDAVLRVPEVWHGVTPIRRLRRYAGGSFTSRGVLSPAMQTRREKTLAERQSIDPDSIPSAARKHWGWSGIGLE